MTTKQVLAAKCYSNWLVEVTITGLATRQLQAKLVNINTNYSLRAWREKKWLIIINARCGWVNRYIEKLTDHPLCLWLSPNWKVKIDCFCDISLIEKIFQLCLLIVHSIVFGWGGGGVYKPIYRAFIMLDLRVGLDMFVFAKSISVTSYRNGDG